tara:strand:- start:2574 stop:2873 length:300 start_codon:yes stop_codon:yes gene_type:complete
MEIIKFKDAVSFSEPFTPRILRAKPNHKVPLICMNPGQEIPPHPSGMGIFYIVKGKAVMTIEGKSVDVAEGDMIFVEDGESRGIKAIETLVAFAVHISS